MATRVSQEHWETIITQAEHDSSAANSQRNEASGIELGASAVAGSIDHTLLKLDATSAQIDGLCEEARRFNFKSVCVRKEWVKQAVHNLKGSSVVVACVVGFHKGTALPEGKALEAASAVQDGAKELDMVINHVWLREKRYQMVCDDIIAVRTAGPHPVVLKVILETSVLVRQDIIAGCKIAEAANADFVKTSTGFNGPGATVENVELMKAVVGDRMKVKASGGIRSLKDLKAMVVAGAERIGASSGVSIMKEAGTQRTADRPRIAADGQAEEASNPY